MTSRWASTPEDAAEHAKRRAEKAEKKRAKARKQREDQEQQQSPITAANGNAQANGRDAERPVKRRRLSHVSDNEEVMDRSLHSGVLRFSAPSWQPCRSVERFIRLNRIEEGSYGFVSRAREESTGQVVALKRLKMDPTRDGGFPVTALREIHCLHAARHKHIVNLREVVADTRLARQDVYLVMDFLEHDLKTLQEDMDEPFRPSEIKTLLLQLGSAVEFLHDHWIIHRDLKTSNILMNNRGQIKLADFGMARVCGNPSPPNLTQLVVTLWYRAPELLLGTTAYDSAIDMWSVGCIFGELLVNMPLLQGKSEVDQLGKVFELCGIPNDKSWPKFRRLPNARTLRLPTNDTTDRSSMIRLRFPTLTDAGVDLLSVLLSLDPAGRPSAGKMLEHPYFLESPRPKPDAMFPTFPSKAGQEKRRRRSSPEAPIRGVAPSLQGDVDFSSILKTREQEQRAGGFQLKLQ